MIKTTLGNSQLDRKAIRLVNAPRPLTFSNPFACFALLLASGLLLTQTGCVGVTGAKSTSAAPTTSAGTTNPANPSQMSLTASVTSLNFPGVAVGGNSTLPVIFTNSGTSSVTVSNMSIAGAGFNASGVPTGTILAAGQTATLNVTFGPSATGSVKGTAILTSNAANSPQTISLIGSAVAAAAQHSVSLTWTDTSVVAGYNVYQSAVSGGTYRKLTSSLDASPSFTDTTVRGGQTYYYVVTAVDSNGLESVYSGGASAVIPNS